jgi:hypothetical protein
MARSRVAIAATAAVFALCVAVAHAAPRRRVDCSHEGKDIPAHALDAYSLGFVDETVQFDTLAYSAFAAWQGQDVTEFLNTVNSVKASINALNTSTSKTSALWTRTWKNLGDELIVDAITYAARGDNISAASAYRRASNAYQLGGRFGQLMSADSLELYRHSVDAFVAALGLDTNGVYAACQQVFVPFGNSSMHGYWCPTAVDPANAPTIISVNGYDGTAEMDTYVIASAFNPRGFNVLAMEGPGQGYTARFLGLHFFPDFERVTSALYDYATTTLAVDASTVILWGTSFGGYLAPRGFAYDTRFAALVANGGVLDFYQVMVCKFTPQVRQTYYMNIPQADAEINGFFANATEVSMAANFMWQYGRLGFGPNATSLTAIFDMMEPYNLLNDTDKFNNRPLFVYDPAWDTLTGNQSQLFFYNISNRSADAEIVTLDPYRGAALHCGVGGTANLNNRIAQFLYKVFGNPLVAAKQQTRQRRNHARVGRH